jgi:hypothetical protein
MWFISKIAEARMVEAIERGELDNLAGGGKPLRLDDDRAVPEELRLAYRILKNAGCLPRELEWRREIADIRQLMGDSPDALARERGWRRINYLMAQLEAARGVPVDLRIEQSYHEKLVERLDPAGSNCSRSNGGGAPQRASGEPPERRGTAKSR